MSNNSCFIPFLVELASFWWIAIDGLVISQSLLLWVQFFKSIVLIDAPLPLLRWFLFKKKLYFTTRSETMGENYHLILDFFLHFSWNMITILYNSKYFIVWLINFYHFGLLSESQLIKHTEGHLVQGKAWLRRDVSVSITKGCLTFKRH